MKHPRPLLVALAGALAAGLALSQDPVDVPQGGDARVLELEARVAELEAWVLAQQQQAKATKGTLAAVEEKGFTAGINYESRELLLAALRAEADQVLVGAPDALTKDDDADERRR